MRLAVYIGFTVALVSLGAFSTFTVPVDSEALVLRGTEVNRKVGPGLQVRMPFLEKVVTEPVLRERLFNYDTAFEIQGCRADVAVIYRVGDLEAFHASNGGLMALEGQRGAIEMSLDALPDLSVFAESERPYGQQISERLQPLAGPAADGLYVNRIDVSLEDGCEPKRILKETPLSSVAAQRVDAYAPERAAPGYLNVTTSDGVDILIEGFVATFRIDDTARVETCFGQNRGIVATRVGHLAEATGLEVVEGLALDQMAELPERLHEALLDNDTGDCGLSFGAVDFNEATFTRRTVVNCEETPTEDCLPQSFVFPGLSVQD